MIHFIAIGVLYAYMAVNLLGLHHENSSPRAPQIAKADRSADCLRGSVGACR